MVNIVRRSTNLEYSIKMISCLVIGLLVTKMIGYPNVVTIPITAFLVCWSYRGAKGSVSYFGFRLRIQLIFVIIDTLAWYGITYIWPSSLPWHRFVVLSSILIPIYLQLYYRFKIMPLDLTAVFSTLIILAGLMGTIDYGIRRMLWNVCGLVIGGALTYLIPSPTKLSKVRQSLVALSQVWLKEFKAIVQKGKWELSASFQQYLADSTAEMTSIQTYIAIVDRDIADTTTFPLKLFPKVIFSYRYRASSEELMEIRDLITSTNAMIALARHIGMADKRLDQMEARRKEYYISCIETISASYESILASNDHGLPETETFIVDPESEEEVLLLDAVLGYAAAVKKCNLPSACLEPVT